MEKVIVICGPTCVGKTSLSIKLAKLLNGEIINGDSMQVYKEMNIGTAKIKEDEKENIPHHLFDIKTIKESFSVAEFQKLVRQKIEEITKKNKMPIIVGGTGLYLKACLYDYEFLEKEDHPSTLNTKSSEELYSLLESLDPLTASSIHPNNKKRIIRAIEIYYENGVGKVKAAESQTHKPIYDVIFIGLTRDRKKLYELINERVDSMLNKGLLDEVKYVIDNASLTSTCLQAIGYKEFIPYFNKEDELNNCIELVKKNTRQFAKRQYTWFNHQMDVNWINVDDKNIDEILEDAKEIIGNRYGKIY